MDRGAWWVIVCSVMKSQTRLSDFARTKRGHFSVLLLPERLSVVFHHPVQACATVCPPWIIRSSAASSQGSRQRSQPTSVFVGTWAGPLYGAAESPLFSFVPCRFFLFLNLLEEAWLPVRLFSLWRAHSNGLINNYKLHCKYH